MCELQVYLTLHSYGQYLLIPWGFDVQFPSDYNDMKDLANRAASTFRRYKYTVGNSADLLYPAAGIVHSADIIRSDIPALMETK